MMNSPKPVGCFAWWTERGFTVTIMRGQPHENKPTFDIVVSNMETGIQDYAANKPDPQTALFELVEPILLAEMTEGKEVIA